MIRRRLIAVICTAALLLTGCTSLSLSGPDILAPPKAAGNRAEVQRMIEKDAGGSYTLIYPTSGSYKSGIILHDINGDGADEAIALYTASDSTPRLLIAEKKDDSYELYGSARLSSSNITGLSFADVDADGTQELIIGSDTGSPLSALYAYFVGDEVSGAEIAEGFSDYTVGDFDGNSADDILLLTPPDGETAAQAKLMVYSDSVFGEKSSCETDSDVVSYARLSFDKISDGIYAAIADGRLDSGAYTTQLLYYDSAAHMLVNPLFQNSSYRESMRIPAVGCADIDGDGIIDVPLCTLTEHGKDEDTTAVCGIAHWSDYDPELMALSLRQDSLLCDQLGFMLMLSAEELGGITARYTADNAVTLYSITYKNAQPEAGSELLTVKRYDKNSYDSSLTAEADLYSSPAYIYTYVLSEGSSFTHEEIENSFKLLEADEAYTTNTK